MGACALLAVLWLCAPSGFAEEPGGVLPDAAGVHFVLGPEEDASLHAFKLRIAPNGQPMVVRGDLLVGLQTGDRAAVAPFRIGDGRLIRDLTWSVDGALLLVTDTSMGAWEDGAYHVLVDLPEPDMRVEPGGPERLYLFGGESIDQRKQLYQYRRGGSLVLLTGFPAPIRAVAGDGRTTYVAAGTAIYVITSGGEAALAHEAVDDVVSLAATRRHGLFFSTASTVSYLYRPGLAVDLLGAKGAVVRARDDEVYALLPEFGVLALGDPAEYDEMAFRLANTGASAFDLGLAYLDGVGMAEDIGRARRWFQVAHDAGEPRAGLMLGKACASGDERVEPDMERALALLTVAADDGDPEALTELGSIYRGGRDMPEDPERARAYFTAAAKAGHTPARTELGWMAHFGEGMERNGREARRWFEAGAAVGELAALDGMGLSWEAETGVPDHAEQALRWFTRATDAGSWRSTVKLADLLYEGTDTVPQDNPKALEYYEQSAEHSAYGCWRAGRMHELGRVVEENPEQAYRFYLRAAELDYPSACKDLGQCYAEGSGTPADPFEAMYWFLRCTEVAEVGSSELRIAMLELGDLYVAGEGVPRDDRAAAYWYERAAELGYDYAASQLAKLYLFDSDQLDQDPQRALSLWTRQYERGSSWAPYWLGMMYLSGLGVERDLQAVHAYFVEGVNRGNLECQAVLGVMYFMGHGVPRDRSRGLVLLYNALSRGNDRADAFLRPAEEGALW